VEQTRQQENFVCVNVQPPGEKKGRKGRKRITPTEANKQLPFVLRRWPKQPTAARSIFNSRKNSDVHFRLVSIPDLRPDKKKKKKA